MDDLEEIWGPRGRATVDPGSVRPAARPAEPPAAAPPAPAPPAALLPAAPPPAQPVSSTTSSGRPPHLARIGAGTAVVVAAVLVIALMARPSDAPVPVSTNAAASPTTIVSAAADLLGRGRATTTTEAAPALGTSPGPPPSAPPTAPTPPPPTAPAPLPSASPPPARADRPPLALAEQAAHEFVDVISRRDCDGLWNLLSRDTQTYLSGSAEPGQRSGRDELCDELRSEETIPPMRVHGPAEVRGDGAAVPLESEGEVEDLIFVAEDGRWVIDLFGDAAEQS